MFKSESIQKRLLDQRILVKAFPIPEKTQFKYNEDGSKSTTIIISGKNVDISGDVVNPLGLKLRNARPALIVHHDQHSDPIGRIDKIWHDENFVYADITFHAKEEDPRGGRYGYMAEFGSFTHVSIGFLALKGSEAEDRKDSYTRPLNIDESLLFEVSFVNCPANDLAGLEGNHNEIVKSHIVKGGIILTKKGAYMKDAVENASADEKEVPVMDLKSESVNESHDKTFEDMFLEVKNHVDESLKAALKSVDEKVAEMVKEAVDAVLEVKTANDIEPDGKTKGFKIAEEQYQEFVKDYLSTLEEKTC